MAGQMSIREAERLLGLDPPYAREDVAAAHRAAIRDNHPDVLVRRGVSPEEAKERAIRVNAARQVLLDELNGASAQRGPSAGAGAGTGAGAGSGTGAGADAGAAYARPASPRPRPQQASPQERPQASPRQASAAGAAPGAPAGAAPQAAAGAAPAPEGKRARVNRGAVKWIVLSYVLVSWSASALLGLAYAFYQMRVLLLNVTYWGILTDPPLMIFCWAGTMVFGWLAKRENGGELPTSSRVARWLAFAVFVCMNALYFVPPEFLAAVFGGLPV